MQGTKQSHGHSHLHMGWRGNRALHRSFPTGEWHGAGGLSHGVECVANGTDWCAASMPNCMLGTMNNRLFCPGRLSVWGYFAPPYLWGCFASQYLWDCFALPCGYCTSCAGPPTTHSATLPPTSTSCPYRTLLPTSTPRPYRRQAVHRHHAVSRQCIDTVDCTTRKKKSTKYPKKVLPGVNKVNANGA